MCIINMKLIPLIVYSLVHHSKCVKKLILIMLTAQLQCELIESPRNCKLVIELATRTSRLRNFYRRWNYTGYDSLIF